MPNDDGYVLDFESVQRIGRMLRNYERGVTKPGMTGADGLQLEEGTTYVEVTGAATAPGYYPGCEKFWDLEANAWHYAPTPCVVWEINGSTLEQGKVYKATLVTNFVQGGAQKNVFAVQASGGGGGTTGSTLIFVKLTNAVAMTGVQQTYNPATKVWTDGAVALNLVEINGNTVPVNKRMLAMLISGTTYAVGLDPAAVTSVTCNGGNLVVSGRN